MLLPLRIDVIANHTGKTIDIETDGRVLATTGGIVSEEGNTVLTMKLGAESTTALTTTKGDGKEKTGGIERIERIIRRRGSEVITVTRVGGGHNTHRAVFTTTTKNGVTTDGDSRTDEMTDRTTANTDIENDIPLLLLTMHP